jgi:hypothetical protein
MILNNTEKELIKDKRDMSKLLIVDSILTGIIFKRSFDLNTLSLKFDTIEFICGISSLAVLFALIGLYSATNTKLKIVNKLSKFENLINEKIKSTNNRSEI